VKLIDELDVKFEREMERTKPLDRIYAAISTLVLGLVVGLYFGIPVNRWLTVQLRRFSWTEFLIGFFVVWIFFPAIHKSIRAWRERRFF
jgi:high-affinity Fe2+/Pb2+ permease